MNVVMQRTGLSRSAIYEMMKQGIFPQSMKISKRSVGWIEDDIDSWINSLGERKNVKI